jgi:hypothetical protein
MLPQHQSMANGRCRQRYQRQQPIHRPKFGPWLGVIDAILNDDEAARPGDVRAVGALSRDGYAMPDDCFVAAFPAETTKAFLEGHVRAFAYFGGVSTRILYDNTKIAVARILGG